MTTKWTCIIIAIVLLSCDNKSPNIITEGIALKSSLYQLPNESEIDFRELCSFEFDTLIILKPYSNIGFIEEQCGMNIVNTEWYKNNKHRKDLTAVSEDICLLVFTLSETVVAYIECDRSKIDFAETDLKYARKESVFRIESKDDWRRAIH